MVKVDLDKFKAVDRDIAIVLEISGLRPSTMAEMLYAYVTAIADPELKLSDSQRATIHQTAGQLSRDLVEGDK